MAVRTIHKYAFEVTDDVVIEMPAGAEVLAVQVQNGSPCVWAEVDTDAPMQKRTFRVAGTGHPLDLDRVWRRHVGTFQLRGGRLYDFQKSGAEFLRSRRRAILADEMGVGKTATALAALCACPSSRRRPRPRSAPSSTPRDYLEQPWGRD